MLELIVILAIVILIAMPVVAILLMGLQRARGLTWPPRALAIASLGITAVLAIGYLSLQ